MANGAAALIWLAGLRLAMAIGVRATAKTWMKFLHKTRIFLVVTEEA